MDPYLEFLSLAPSTICIILTQDVGDTLYKNFVKVMKSSEDKLCKKFMQADISTNIKEYGAKEGLYAFRKLGDIVVLPESTLLLSQKNLTSYDVFIAIFVFSRVDLVKETDFRPCGRKKV